MSNRTIQLTDNLYNYLLSVSLREHPVLKELREFTSQLPEHNMQIAPEQGQFLALMVEILQAKNVLEIGTFTGYSALAMALALPPQGKLITCDISTSWTEVALRFWKKAGLAHKIELILQPALQTLKGLPDAYFDLAFIDADKENYKLYYEECLRLVRQGGIIMLDNMLWSGKVADPSSTDPATKALQSLNTFLRQDERVSLSLLPLADGLTIAYKR